MAGLHVSERAEGTGGAALSDETISVAIAAADASAFSAGVTIRELIGPRDLGEVYRLYDSIWHPDPTNPPVTTEILCALSKAGNYVVGAFDGVRLVGACVGFFGAPADGAIHSHIAGVSAGLRGRSVGFALKLHQRAWVNRPGFPGGSQSTEDESHGSTEEVQRRVACAGDADGVGGAA